MNRIIHPPEAASFRKTDLFPEYVNCLGLAAPAGPVPPAAYENACRFLTGMGLRIVRGKSVLQKDRLSYISAPAEKRAEDLNDLIRNPEIDAVYCLRGGYGSVHLLDLLDWTALRRRKLPVAGYSDITVLHAAMVALQAGRALSACMALNLAKDAPKAVFRQNFKRAWGTALQQRGEFRRIAHLRSLNHNEKTMVKARLFCGNLTMLASLCGTGYLPKMNGKIVFLEDISEPVRKLDRTLMQLKLSGFFQSCAGVVFGNFKQCGSPEERLEFFQRFAARLDAPAFYGLHYGHCPTSVSLVCGEAVLIRNGSLYLIDPFSAEKS